MSGQLPAQWFPDPEGRAALRWWDGVWWTSWESDGARQWLGTPPGPARAPGPGDVAALTFVRTILLPEARRRGVVDEEVVADLGTLTDRLATEVATPPTALAPPTAAAPAAPVPPIPSHDGSFRAPAHAGAPGGGDEHPGRIPANPAHPAQRPHASSAPPGPGPAAGNPSTSTTHPAPAGPQVPGRLAPWWARARERLGTDIALHGLTYLGVLLLFVGVFGLVAFAFGDVEPGLRPVAELAVAAVPFAAAWLLARSGARFVARAMVAVGGLILPVMVVTSTVDGFPVPPDLHGPALPLGAGLACGTIAVAYAMRVSRRPDSALGVMVAPAVWLTAATSALALARPAPRGEDVAVPGAAQVAVVALAVLATTWLARRVLDRLPSATGQPEAAGPDADPPTDATGAELGRSPASARLAARTALAQGARAAAPAGVVVVAVLALVAGAAEGWPLVPFVVTAAALALTASWLLPSRQGDVLTAAWLVVVGRVLLTTGSTPLVSEHVVAPGVALAAQPALLLVALAAGAGLLELMARRTRTGVAFAVVAWALVVVALIAVIVPGGAVWGLAGAVVLTGWSALRRATPPPLPGASLALDGLAALAPVTVVAGVWRHVDGTSAGLLTAALALAVTPLARGRLRRGPTDRLWRHWWVGSVVTTLVAAIVLGGGGPLAAGVVHERAAVAVMLALAVASLVAGPGPRVRAVVLATPVVWWWWAAVVAASGGGAAGLTLGPAALGLGAVLAAHLVRGAASTRFAVATTGYVTGAVAVLGATDEALLAAALGASTLAWLVTAVVGDRGRSPVVARLDRSRALRPLAWVLTIFGLPATTVAALHAGEVVRLGDPWWTVPFVVAALASAAATRVRTSQRLAAALPWSAFGLAGLTLLGTVVGPVPPAAATGWDAVVTLATLVAVAPLTRARHRVVTWTAWLALAPLAGTAAWAGSAGVRHLGGDVVATGALVGVGGLLAVGALLGDRARPGAPRLAPRTAVAVPPFFVGAGQLVLGALGALALAALETETAVPGALSAPDTTPVPGTLLLAVAVFAAAIAGLGGIGTVGAAAAVVAWGGAQVLVRDAYPGAWADVGVVALLLTIALVASLVRPPAWRAARWDVPFALAATLPALAALGGAHPTERAGVTAVVGGLTIAAAVRLSRRRVLSESLATLGSGLVLLGAAWASRSLAVAALAGLAVAHTALAARRESGTWRVVRQWVGAVLAAAAWLVFLGGPAPLGGSAQARADVTAVAAALVTLTVLGAAASGRLDRSWTLPWGTVGALLAVGAAVGPALAVGATGPTLAPGADVVTGTAAVTASWWHVLAWALLTAATEPASRLPGERVEGEARRWRSGWRTAGVVPVVGALLAGLGAASAGAVTRVSVLAAVSLGTALVVVLTARGARRGRTTQLVALGTTTTVLAAATALAAPDGTSSGAWHLARPALLAVVLAVAAVQSGAYGVALRALGLRLAAPVLAWLAWFVLAVDALGGVVFWHTVPVGLAMIAVVEVWRSDRRRRGRPAIEPGVAALDLAGIAFLVGASFVSAFTAAVWHALVAAGIGVLVFCWAAVTRVRRRLVAGAGIVLAGLVVAVVLPLAALVPAWGGAALWVAVAVVGLLVVLAATFLERGRAAVQGGRARFRAATAGWE